MTNLNDGSVESFVKRFLILGVFALCVYWFPMTTARATVYECVPKHTYAWWLDSEKDAIPEVDFDDENGDLDIGIHRVFHLDVKNKFHADGSGEIFASKEGSFGDLMAVTSIRIRHIVPRLHKKELYFTFISGDDGATGTCNVSTQFKTLRGNQDSTKQ